jgi:sugar phosphate permease
VAGIFQSGGWPSNVAVMGVWFGKSTRGLVMGVWNAHTSIGNILGALIATWAMEKEHYRYDLYNTTKIPSFGIGIGKANYSWVPLNYTCDVLKTMMKGVADVNLTKIAQCDTWAQHECDKMQDKCKGFFRELGDMNATDKDDWTQNYHFLNHTAATNSTPMAGNDTDFKYVSAYAKDIPWDMSFYFLGAWIAFFGIVVFLFLVPHPKLVWMQSPDEEERQKTVQGGITQALIDEKEDGEEEAIGFIKALCIPGVIEFALAFFFAKFVSYTFLFWLPFYLESIGIDKTQAGFLSTFFDYGGIFGGISCGLISDFLGMRAIVASASMMLSVPAMYVYRLVITSGSHPQGANILLMFIAGTFVNGTYALITTAVSADLGTHPQLKGNSKGLAMVTAIIDGTGSLGACITGVALGAIRNGFEAHHMNGWNGVFLVLEICAGGAALMLTRLVLKELGCISRAATGPAGGIQRS